MDKQLAKNTGLRYRKSMGADRKLIKTKYPGVYYRESTARKHAGKPDRTYTIWYLDAQGKDKWLTIGRASAGISPQFANAKRQEIVSGIARGDDPVHRRRFTVGQAIEAYSVWARAEDKAVEREIARYDLHIRADLDALPIEALTTPMLSQLKARLLTRLSAGSTHHCFSFVRRAINFAMSEKLYTGVNPLASTRSGKWKMPKVQNSGERFLTANEAKALLADLAKRSQQLHDMSLLSLRTGMRATEIFGIRSQDVHRQAGVISCTAKGGLREQVPASPEIIEMLLSYPRRPGEFVFQAEDGGKIICGISSTFSRAVDRLGLNKGVTDRRHRVWFHTLRHTFASWMAQSGKVTLIALKEIMRHKSISMTLRYAHLIPGHQHETLSIIDEILQRADETPPTPPS